MWSGCGLQWCRHFARQFAAIRSSIGLVKSLLASDLRLSELAGPAGALVWDGAGNPPRRLHLPLFPLCKEKQWSATKRVSR